MGVIVVTGIPGVGKTTVMKKAAEGMDIEFVTFGTIMIDIAKEIGLVKDRDEMRKLTLDQQRDLQIRAAEKAGGMKNVVVDTHCTIKTPKGYMPGTEPMPTSPYPDKSQPQPEQDYFKQDLLYICCLL